MAQITKQSSDAIEGFEANQDSYLRRTQELEATLKDLKVAVGTALLPAIDDLVKAMLPLVQRFAKWAERNPEVIKGIIIFAGVLAGLVAVVGILGNLLASTIGRIAGFIKWLGKFRLIKTIATIMSRFRVIILAVRVAFVALIAILGAISTPVLVVIGIIVALIAVGVALWKNWEAVSAGIMTAFGAVKDFFVNAWAVIYNAADFAIAFLQGLIFEFLDMIVPRWREDWQMVKDFFFVTWQGITVFFNAQMLNIQTKFKLVMGIITKAWKFFAGVFKVGWELLWGGVTDYFIEQWEAIKDSFKGIVNWIIAQVNRLINAINVLIRAINKVATLGGRIGGGIPEIPNITPLAKGGIVTKPTLAMVGEAGPEAVIPLNRGFAGAGAGINVTLNVGTIIGAGMDMEDLAMAIGDTLVDKLKTNMRV